MTDEASNGVSDEVTGPVTDTLAAVAATLPGGGEQRDGQRRMALAVAGAVAGRRHLVVQAGTGTGKSLAYLIPAALSGERVVVATATKALQDQLASHDLPLVAAAVEGGFTFAVLKGRSNYLCRQRVSEVGGRGQQLSMQPGTADPPDADDPLADSATLDDAADAASDDDGPGTGRLADQVRRLVAWAGDTTTGDRAELDFEPHYRAWAMVSTTARECPGAFRCPSGHECFAEDARTRAAEADVVVVNTHLYGAHLASGGAVLPAHEVVVFDEAHEVEEVMTDSLGVEIGPGRFRALAASARPVVDASAPGVSDTLDAVAAAGDLLQQALRPLAGRRVPPGALASGASGASLASGASTTGGPDATQRGGEAEPVGLELGLAEPVPTRRSPPVAAGDGEPGLGRVAGDGEPGLGRVVELATGRVARLVDQLRRAEREAGDDESSTERSRRDRVVLAAGHLAADLARMVSLSEDEVAWVDDGARSPSLRVSPIDVGPLLDQQLWGSVTGVLTSATVPLGLAERLGLPAGSHDELDVGSPFDYPHHAMLYVAKSLPDRRRPESEPALHHELEVLITAAGGRTLALFTSWRAMRAALDALRDRLPYPLLSQSDLPKPALVEAFREDESACLFATLGFWQGVDLPGRTLSLVTIDRIPFPRPDEPVLQARRDRAGSSAFSVVDLPRAGTLLAQGAGRLIRSADDRGVVAVLDSRLATASYRGALLARVPPMHRSIDRAEVVAFLSSIAGTT
jgi:ATP-dependent DNA helicase DinG